MIPDQTNLPKEGSRLPAADTGNASNPSPHQQEPAASDQLLNEKAEKYIREVANIEDVPDARDQQEMDETMEQEKQPGH